MSDSMAKQLDRLDAADNNDRFRDDILEGGYSRFSELLNELRQRIKIADTEDAINDAHKLVVVCRQLFPVPSTVSPSWEFVWKELCIIVDAKRDAFVQIPPERREGTWQVLVDNPYTTDGVVCHPALQFAEACYLYGYFQIGLNKAEYVRLQKVTDVLVISGATSEED